MSDSEDFEESGSEIEESPASPVIKVKKGKKKSNREEKVEETKELETKEKETKKKTKKSKSRKSSTPKPSDSEEEEDILPDDKEELGLKISKSIERSIEKVIFRAEFTAGYVIRQVLEFYEKLIIHTIPFYFKEKDISIVTGTGKNKAGRYMISTMELFTDDIIDYYLDMDLVNIEGDDESDSCYAEQFSIDLIKSILKSITKTCSILFYKTTTSDTVHLVIKANAVVKTGIRSAKYQVTEHDLTMFDDLPSTPNVKIDTSEFNTSIKGMSKDTNYTSFKVFPEGLHLSYHSPDGAAMKRGSFGRGVPEDMTEVGEDDYYETKVSGSTIKALQKIHGMSSNSILKITSCQDGNLQIRHKIADFGEHRIYLIDNS